MTKKDYVKIAKAIAEAVDSKREIVQSLTIALAAENAKFDASRFVEACGITS